MNKNEILNYIESMLEEADSKTIKGESYDSSQLANELQFLQDNIHNSLSDSNE